jgi:tetratricopeptide (TPR) repeat protein
MNQIKALIHEVHRRSVWQVLLIFLGAGWAVLEVIDTFIDRGLLPDWAFNGAVLVLLLGLPVVLATAFVQEEPRLKPQGSESSKTETPVEGKPRESTEQDGPEPVFAGLEEAPSYVRLARLLTWNRAILGGILAFALLGVVATGYMSMRVLGIGAPGTLVASGVFDEGEMVVLADFTSAAPSVPAELVTEALRLSLDRSPTIRLMQPAALTDALERMERDQGEGLDEELARELAMREGLKAIVAGDVAPLGGRFVLSARLVDAASGRVIAPFRETVRDTTRLLDAIDRLGRSIRDKSGEPLSSIQADPPLQQVTTSSLEALRLYTQAYGVERRGEAIRATDLYREATEVDPEFAMAHRKLGVQLGNSFGSRTEQVEAYTRAYELRDNLPPVERFVADATYFHLVVGDLDAAARGYENVLELDPTNEVALNNLGIVYSRSGKNADAERVYRLGIETDASNSNYVNLAGTLFLQDKRHEVQETLAEWKERFPESYSAWMYPGWVAFAAGDYEVADSLFEVLVQQFPRNPLARFYGNAGHWIIGSVQGRVREADVYGREFVRSSEAVGLDRWALNGEAMRALMIATYHQDTVRALAQLRDAMLEYPLHEMEPLDRSYLFMARALADLGQTDMADSLYREFLVEVPEQYWGDLEDEDPREVAALLLAARGDVEGAIDELRPLKLDCFSLCRMRVRYSLAQLYERRGELESAAQEYEDYVTRTEIDRLREDGYRYPPALIRLAEINEQLGRLEQSAGWYERFAELWRNADPEFQPAVQAAANKAAELRARIN